MSGSVESAVSGLTQSKGEPGARLANPRVLLTDTYRSGFTARLAIGLTSVGCDVAGICPLRHPLHKTRAVRDLFRYNSFAPLDSLRTAIRAFNPQMIVPCDDRGVQHLHELASLLGNSGPSDDATVRLIEDSLGSPSSYSIVSSRNELLKIAREEGLPVPRTDVVNSYDDLRRCMSEHQLPLVLKVDGTSGGRGVRIVHNDRHAKEFFLELTNIYRATRTIKRLCINRDAFWVRPWWEGTKSNLVAQSYVEGRPANCAVLSFQGKVLAGLSVEAVTTRDPTGPACIVRVVENESMMIAAERIARRLQLSGFFGLDFVIEEQSQTPFLIEMNPRCTPLCHLQLGQKRDMIAQLWALLSGRPAPRLAAMTENPLIAYFPQAWGGNTTLFDASFHDVPEGEPDLVRELLDPWPERSLVSRIFAYLDELSRSLGEHVSSDMKRRVL